MLVRQGECNQCGECCGRETAGGQAANPWQRLAGMRNWKLVDVQAEIPHIQLLGATEAPDGRFQLATPYGQIQIRGLRMDWVLDDDGLHKPDNLECPALVDGEGDTKYACALVGTQYESRMYTDWCREGPQGIGFPALEYVDDENKTAQQKHDDWFDSFPGCSFTYTEVPD
jgi:hypothetical protein